MSTEAVVPSLAVFMCEHHSLLDSGIEKGLIDGFTVDCSPRPPMRRVNVKTHEHSSPSSIVSPSSLVSGRQNDAVNTDAAVCARSRARACCLLSAATVSAAVEIKHRALGEKQLLLLIKCQQEQCDSALLCIGQAWLGSS